MRRLPGSWNKTIAKLGFARRLHTRNLIGRGVRLRGEQLEDRRVLATLVVNTTSDGPVDSSDPSKLSLREAIAAINQQGWNTSFNISAPHNSPAVGWGIDDRIEFDPSIFGQTISLGSEGDLDIYRSLTIDGPGPSQLSIDASAVGTSVDNGDGIRIFSIGDGTSMTVAISGLKLTGGDVSGSGGAILVNQQATTYLSGMELDNNAATSAGGGLAVVDAEIYVDEVVFSENDASDGGGFSISSNVGGIDFEIVNSVARKNKAQNGGGGFVQLRGETMSAALMQLRRSLFSENEARVRGGGLLIDSALNVDDESADVAFEITDCTVSWNSAFGSDDINYLSGGMQYGQGFPHKGNAFDGGGGIHFTRSESHPNDSVEFKLINSTVSGNKAERGGGMALNGKLDTSHSTIVRNEAGHFGDFVRDEFGALEPIPSGQNEGKFRVETTGGGGVVIYNYDPNRAVANDLGDAIVQLPTFSHTILARNSHFLEHWNDADYVHYGMITPNLAITYSSAANQNWPGEEMDESPAATIAELADLNSPTPPSGVTPEAWEEHVKNHSALLVFDYCIIDDRRGPLEPSIYGGPEFGRRINFTNNTFIPVATYDGPAENDPLIRPLDDNGGFKLPDGSTILTHKILCGSPARDAGDPSIVGAPQYDQRGNPYPREFGGSIDGIIDIGAYELGSRDFPALAADFNGDLKVDAADLQIWKDNYGTHSTLGDADGDLDVDKNDLLIWQDQFGEGVDPNALENADFNGDNVVDGADFMIWQRTLGQTGVSLQGDANNDGIVDGVDFLIWQRSVGQQAGCEGWADQLQFFAQLQPGKIVVSTLDDVDDGYYGLGELSLREAIYIASQNSGFDEIVFAEELVGTIIVSAELAVGSELWITGPGAEKLSIDADGLSRVFSVASGVEATISGLTITGGYTTGGGGGIYNLGGDLTLDSVVITGNTAGGGGGIATYNWYSSPGSLRITNSTIDGNRAGAGSGIQVIASYGAEIVIDRSTISNNLATGIETAAYSEGGGLSVAGDSSSSVTITNSTFSGNAAKYGGGLRFYNSATPTSIVNTTIANNIGGGIDRVTGSTAVALHNSIVAENVDILGAKLDVINNFAAGSTYNLIGSGGAGGLTNGVANNIVLTSVQNAGLAPLGDYGGKTKTHALKTSSRAIDKGSAAYALTYDQRGFPREYDMMPNGTFPNGTDGYRDIGAYEASTGTTLIVRNDGDRNDSVDLRATIDSLRLREALSLANSLAGWSEVITFDQTGWSDNEIQLSSGQLSIPYSVSVVGPGADKLTVKAAPGNRALVLAGSDASLSGMRITGGNGPGNGMGVYVLYSSTLDRVQIDGNSGEYGAGIYVHASASLTLKNSTLWDNSASQAGGGLYAGSLASVTILNSTISGNGALYGGGGVYTSATSNLRVVNSTIAYNSGGSGTGGISAGGNARLDNTIVAHNASSSSALDISGSFDSSSTNNLIGFDSATGNGIDNSGTNRVGGQGGTLAKNARLKALADYGGGILTHALYSDSDAIDKGDNAVAAAFSLTKDQRGNARVVDFEDDNPLDDIIDIGAIELAMEEIYS